MTRVKKSVPRREDKSSLSWVSGLGISLMKSSIFDTIPTHKLEVYPILPEFEWHAFQHNFFLKKQKKLNELQLTSHTEV